MKNHSTHSLSTHSRLLQFRIPVQERILLRRRFDLLPVYSFNSYIVQFVSFRTCHTDISGYFLFGAALCQSLSNVAKYSVGRLRPHFISICKPSFNISICVNHTYIEEPHCMGDPRRVREGRLSFPSGHSSFAFYTMMFAIFYIQAQLLWPTVRLLLKPLVQFTLLCLALATALSRISNYKHHWSDVLAGSILGISCATVMVRVFSQNTLQCYRKSH
uniref:Phosphatidic acid phosphatase type 2/haloperoxidase domain-containing protein n=1 Tax=Romanomermis culicivorax TaxID=13658 RepID=A0A915JGS0_ROMCU